MYISRFILYALKNKGARLTKKIWISRERKFPLLNINMCFKNKLINIVQNFYRYRQISQGNREEN